MSEVVGAFKAHHEDERALGREAIAQERLVARGQAVQRLVEVALARLVGVVADEFEGLLALPHAPHPCAPGLDGLRKVDLVAPVEGVDDEGARPRPPVDGLVREVEAHAVHYALREAVLIPDVDRQVGVPHAPDGGGEVGRKLHLFGPALLWAWGDGAWWLVAGGA